LPTIFQHSFEGDNYEFVTPLVLMPCTRRHITQYFRFHWVVRFSMCSCGEQNYTRLYAFLDQGC